MPDPTFATESLTVMQPQRTFAVGDVIGNKYRVEGLLGSGGMGVVLGATHLDLDAPVAIKVLREELVRSEEVVARMLLEARAAARMRGAHVVRVLDVARLPSGAPYIVMERLEGVDLADLLAARGSLTIDEAVDYLLQACEGLSEAHAAGIVHRDLKPENLFLAQTPEGQLLKILDFGISKSIGGALPRGPRNVLTNAGYAVGSPYYMSPEQMRASPDVDARADVWSLGAILYELLSGKCPFDGESLAVVCANVLGHEPEPLLVSDEHAALWSIVQRCLRKDADERFASVTELATALRDFTSGNLALERGARLASGINLKSEHTMTASPTPGLISSSPRRRSWRRALAFAAVVGVAGGAAAAVRARPMHAETRAPLLLRPAQRAPFTLPLVTIVGERPPLTLPEVTLIAAPPPVFVAHYRAARTVKAASSATATPSNASVAPAQPVRADSDRFGGRY